MSIVGGGGWGGWGQDNRGTRGLLGGKRDNGTVKGGVRQ